VGTVLLVRHGQASFGADDYDVLSQLGWKQGRATGRFLAGTESPSSWVRGGMRRHRETLEAMTSADADVDERWDEFDHVGIVATHPDAPVGDVDPRTFQRAFERATADWVAGTHGGDGESYPDFVARVRGALDDAVADAGPGRTVVVVTSGGPIAVAAALLVDPDADPARVGALWARFNTVVVNAAVTRVVVGSTGARLLAFNEHAHLAPEQRTYR
jgi:broad specificity phosphatase PhoE